LEKVTFEIAPHPQPNQQHASRQAQHSRSDSDILEHAVAPLVLDLELAALDTIIG
jgi:hypothetical protein